MAISYTSKLSTLKTVLDTANTTTATPDLSGSLTTRIRNIYKDDPAIRGLRGDDTPALFISINRAEEDETQMGDFTNRKKEKLIVYDIHGIYKKESYAEQHSDLLTDFYQMADNVEAVLKKESDLSGTALHVSVVDTEFKGEQPENTLLKVFKIGLEVRYIYS